MEELEALLTKVVCQAVKLSDKAKELEAENKLLREELYDYKHSHTLCMRSYEKLKAAYHSLAAAHSESCKPDNTDISFGHI